MELMTAAVWVAPNLIEVTERNKPTRQPGEVLIEVERVGICGTDLAIVNGAHPRAQSGLIPGHEVVGVVVEADDERLVPGTRVAVEPLISCGQCRACSIGATHVCRELGLYGIDVAGGLAKYMTVPAKVVHAVPDSVDVDHAALIEPLAVAVHAVSLAKVAQDDVVAIYGAGPIGVLTAMVSKQAGAKHIVIAEPNQWRRDKAQELGFTSVAGTPELTEKVKELTGGEGADVTFDSAGHPAVAPDLADVTRVLGTIGIVGVHKNLAEVDLRAVCFKEQTIIGMRVYTTEDFANAIAMIAEGLDLSGFPVAHFALADISDAVQAATDGADALKVLVTPGDIS